MRPPSTTVSPSASSSTTSVTVDSRVSGVGSSEPTISSASSCGGDRRRVGDLGHGLAGADHGDRVGDGEHLVELVGDEDHGRALGREPAQAVEQLVDLLGHEHRGGLVEDQDPRAAVEHLEDLDPLALADAELLDELVGVDVEAVAVGQLARSCRRASPKLIITPVVGSLPRTTFSRTVKLSASMKCWWTMPMPRSIASFGERKWTSLAEDLDRALVRRLHAVEDLHQGRLAGAVLADDGMDRSRPSR